MGDSSKKFSVDMSLDKPRYDCSLGVAELSECVRSSKVAQAGFAAKVKVPFEQIVCDNSLVEDIARRVDQRKSYYKYFHGINVSQHKVAAIRAYWYLKYKPLRYLSVSKWNKAYDINVYFAFDVFLNGIIGYIFEELLSCDDKKVVEKSNFTRDMLNLFFGNPSGKSSNGKGHTTLEEAYIHTFAECEISMDAFMLLAETLTRSFSIFFDSKIAEYKQRAKCVN